MTTTRQDIKGWWDNRLENTTHMLVVCDTYEWADYPVYVVSGNDVRKSYAKYNGPNMQKVMEVYTAQRDFESQLNEGRSFNFD